jgi:hypothetical protein
MYSNVPTQIEFGYFRGREEIFEDRVADRTLLFWHEYVGFALVGKG